MAWELAWELGIQPELVRMLQEAHEVQANLAMPQDAVSENKNKATPSWSFRYGDIK